MAFDTTTERDLTDGIVVLKDGSSNSLVLAMDSGGVEIEVPDFSRIVRDRGTLSHRRAGVEEPCTIRVRAQFTQWYPVGTTPVSLAAVMLNAASIAWSSTSGASEPFTIDIDFKIVDPDSGDAEVLTFTKVKGPIRFAEAEDGNTLELEATALMTKPTHSYSSAA